MSLNFINDIKKKVHFIGIGGISMSGLAEIFLKNGYSVSGSDMKESHITKKLQDLGATIYIGHKSENVDNADIVVYTAAIAQDNPELIHAKDLNLTMYDRAEFLGQIMKGHKYNVAVAGTHGKTTTTSMMSHIALSGNLDPTILVGGELDVINGNIRVGKSDYFITEACEYKESFLKFHPYVGIILNVDADHLDYYKDLDHIKQAFAKFINLIPEDGYLVANAEDTNLMEIINTAKCNVLTFGINKGRIRAKDIVFNDNATSTFNVYDGEEKLFQVSLSVPGQHNILNSLATICASLSLNIPKEAVINGLFDFRGTHRRFELKGIKDGISVIDDYAHHPTEIKSTIETAAKYPHKNLYYIFQPHTYTRTYTLFNEFCNCFSGVENLIITDIYAAREKNTGLVSSEQLAEGIKKAGVKCAYMKDFNEIENYLKKYCTNGDVIITVGAGDVFKIGEDFLK